MSIQLDENLLFQMGLGALTTDQKNHVLRRFYEVMEYRVGQRLAALMNQHDLDEFEDLVPTEHRGEGGRAEEAAYDWLRQHFPDHVPLTHDEFAYMTAFVAERVAAAAGPLGMQETRTSASPRAGMNPRDDASATKTANN